MLHISPNNKKKQWICDVFAVSSGRWCNRKQQQQIPFKPNIPNAGRAFSPSRTQFFVRWWFLGMYIQCNLLCSTRTLCGFWLFHLFLNEHTASYPIALQKSSIWYLSSSLSLRMWNTMYDQQKLCDWLLLLLRKKRNQLQHRSVRIVILHYRNAIP